MVELVNVATLVLQAVLVATIVLGVRQRNTSIVVNGTVATLAALLPKTMTLISSHWYETSIVFTPTIPLWIALAGVAHQAGMFGLYDEIWWWDHLTHTLSGSLVAAILYAGFLSLAIAPSPVTVPLVGPAGATVLLAFALGVYWELIELFARTLARRFDFEPVLLHYGTGDTELDLLFDVAGAVLVVALDVRLVLPLTRQFPELTRTVLVGGTAFVLLSSILMVVAVAADGTEWPWSNDR